MRKESERIAQDCSIRINQISCKFVSMSICLDVCSIYEEMWRREQIKEWERKEDCTDKRHLHSQRCQIFTAKQTQRLYDCTVHDKTTPYPLISTIYQLVYLYIDAELFDNACDSEYVVLQKSMGEDLRLEGALGGLQTGCHLLFDPESLIQQHSQCTLLTTETTLEDTRPELQKKKKKTERVLKALYYPFVLQIMHSHVSIFSGTRGATHLAGKNP